MNLVDKSELEMLAYMAFQGIVVLRDGKLTEVNENLAKLTGYDRNEILTGHALHKCIPPKFYRKIFDQAWQVSAGMVETSLTRKDGTVLSVEIEKQIFIYNNELLHILGFRDISHRKRIEEEILKLSVALDQSANEIIITRKNGEIEYINRHSAMLPVIPQRKLLERIPGS
jgi:two-component system, sensor histidine kinase and response regulator